jgi:hypothetical protein
LQADAATQRANERLTGVDHSGVLPDRNPSPLPHLDHVRVATAVPAVLAVATLFLGTAAAWDVIEPILLGYSPGHLMQLQSTLTCPACEHRATETMPTDACQFFYECPGCGTLLRPKAGDCCVFCSYGDMPCPPIQEARASGVPAACCGAA